MAQQDREKFMRRVIELAKQTSEAGAGGPFAAVVVKDGEIVGEGWNRVIAEHDPTWHGEVAAIRDACRKLGTHDLSGCELLNERQGAWRRVPMSAAAGPASAVLTLEELPCAIEAALAGLGVALVPALLVAAELKAQRLVRAADIEAPSEAAFWLVWSNASAKAEMIQRFGAWLKDRLAQPEPAEASRLGRSAAA